MRVERDPVPGTEAGVAALVAEVGQDWSASDPEFVAKLTLRQFTAEHRLWILTLHDKPCTGRCTGCASPELGATHGIPLPIHRSPAAGRVPWIPAWALLFRGCLLGHSALLARARSRVSSLEREPRGRRCPESTWPENTPSPRGAGGPHPLRVVRHCRRRGIPPGIGPRAGCERRRAYRGPTPFSTEEETRG